MYSLPCKKCLHSKLSNENEFIYFVLNYKKIPSECINNFDAKKQQLMNNCKNLKNEKN